MSSGKKQRERQRECEKQSKSTKKSIKVRGLWTSVWRCASTFANVCVWVVCGEVIGEGRQREKGMIMIAEGAV